MHEMVDTEQILRGAIIAVPVTVFLTLAVLLLRRRARDRMSRSETTVARALAVAEVVDPVIVERKIEDALRNDDHASLGPLYLELAEGLKSKGDEVARLAALRSAAGCAALHGPLAAHAIARVELGDAAKASGDLTGACEQWQIARAVFLADGQMQEHAHIDKRMRENGCPTDWVLNDF
ncbi:hypothetical protein [Hyphomicrobium methylovorum]|uniref:hypothetical protein n=1 Tax=Hyphomicrobium methylovorum TaxID=84 RepID=UPI001FEC3720|nr:hypothetical protein [Hyphomicrobium methylovorum]